MMAAGSLLKLSMDTQSSFLMVNVWPQMESPKEWDWHLGWESFEVIWHWTYFLGIPTWECPSKSQIMFEYPTISIKSWVSIKRLGIILLIPIQTNPQRYVTEIFENIDYLDTKDFGIAVYWCVLMWINFERVRIKANRVMVFYIVW